MPSAAIFALLGGPRKSNSDSSSVWKQRRTVGTYSCFNISISPTFVHVFPSIACLNLRSTSSGTSFAFEGLGFLGLPPELTVAEPADFAKVELTEKMAVLGCNDCSGGLEGGCMSEEAEAVRPAGSGG